MLPAVETGRKWSTSTAVAEAESSLKLKDICGVTQLDRCGIGYSQVQLWSFSSAKERRKLVVEEIRQEEEKTRMMVAFGQAQQGAWTRWELMQEGRIS